MNNCGAERERQGERERVGKGEEEEEEMELVLVCVSRGQTRYFNHPEPPVRLFGNLISEVLSSDFYD